MYNNFHVLGQFTIAVSLKETSSKTFPEAKIFTERFQELKVLHFHVKL